MLLRYRIAWRRKVVGLALIVASVSVTTSCESKSADSTKSNPTEAEGQEPTVVDESSEPEPEPERVGPRDLSKMTLPKRLEASEKYPGPCKMTVDSPNGGAVEQLMGFEYEGTELARVVTVDDPENTQEVVQCESVEVDDKGIILSSHSRDLCQGLVTDRTRYDWKKGANAVGYEMSGAISVKNTILLPARTPAFLFGSANVPMSGDVSLEVADGRVESMSKPEPDNTRYDVEYGPHGVAKVVQTSSDTPSVVATMKWDAHGNLLSVHRKTAESATNTKLYYGCWTE